MHQAPCFATPLQRGHVMLCPASHDGASVLMSCVPLADAMLLVLDVGDAGLAGWLASEARGVLRHGDLQGEQLG